MIGNTGNLIYGIMVPDTFVISLYMCVMYSLINLTNLSDQIILFH